MTLAVETPLKQKKIQEYVIKTLLKPVEYRLWGSIIFFKVLKLAQEHIGMVECTRSMMNGFICPREIQGNQPVCSISTSTST
jgi:hypothetical protein